MKTSFFLKLACVGLTTVMGVDSLAIGAVPASTDYVQDGLVAHWDGIDNTLEGGTRSHNANATTWSDLTGNGNHWWLPSFVSVEPTAMISEARSGKTQSVSASGGNAYPFLESLTGLTALSSGVPYTVEVVARLVQWRYTDNYGNLQPIFSTPNGHVGYRSDIEDGFYLFWPKSGSVRTLMNWRPGKAATDMHTFSLTYGTSKGNTVAAMDTRTFTLDESGVYEGAWGTGFSIFNSVRADIRIHAVRVYNRALTANERAQNYQLDCLRFRLAADFPEGYRPVSYLESTGTQLIDTGYLPKQATKMVGDIQFIGAAANRSGALPEASPFGCAEANQARFSMNFGGNATQDNELFTWFDRVDSPVTTLSITPEQRTTRQTFSVDASTGAMTYGTTTFTTNAKSNQHTHNTFHLFGMKRADGTTRPFSYYGLRVYGWQIWDGYEMVRDLIPCYRVWDQEVGLLDRVSGTFYANVGSGVFRYGFEGNPEGMPSEYRALEGLFATGEQYLETDVEMAEDVSLMAEFTPQDASFFRRTYGVDTENNNFLYARSTYTALNPYARPAEGTKVAFLKEGEILGRMSGVFHSAYVWKGDALVSRLEPCYRVADGVAGMYDVVNGEFYPSLGTMPFYHGHGGEVGTLRLGGKVPSGTLIWPENFGGLTDFSLSMWIRNPDIADGETSFGAIVSQGALGGGLPGFCLFVNKQNNARSLNMQLRDSNEKVLTLKVQDADVLHDDTWHHLAYTCDRAAGVVRLYLDGTLVDEAQNLNSTLTGNLTPKPGVNFAIGGRSNGTGGTVFKYKGDVAQVSLWRKALTEDQVTRLRARPARVTEVGLVEAWSLSEGDAGLTGIVSGQSFSYAGDLYYVPDSVTWADIGFKIFIR